MEKTGKAADYAAVRFALFALILIWIGFLTDNFVASLTLSVPVTLLCFVIIKKIAEKTNWKRYPRERLYTHLALMGNDYTMDLFCAAKYLSPSGKAYAVDKDTLYYSAFRFSGITLDDVAVAYRISRDNGASRCIILCKKTSREVMLMAQSLNIKTEFCTAPEIYRLLKSQKRLPDDVSFDVRAKSKRLSLHDVADIAFSEANIRYFVFSGGILALLSFVTPMRLYYVITATLAFLFAIISKVRK